MLVSKAKDVAIDVRPCSSADIPALRALLADTLPTSGHAAGVFEAMNWSADRITACTRGIWVGVELQALVLMGHVLRVVTTAPRHIATLADVIEQQVRADTAAVMGPEPVIAAVHRAFPQATVRHLVVWERAITPRTAGRVRPPEPAQVSSFAAASFQAFSEELGFAPVPSFDDPAYLDLWERAREQGRLLGCWDDAGRCIFRVEIRPALGLVAELRGLWLAPSWRGAGRAGGLLEETLGALATAGVPRAQVIADQDHIVATKLYHRAGFVRVGRLCRLELPRVGG